MGRDDIETANNIILPPFDLKKLPQEIENYFFFRILNIEVNIYTHCSVLEFTAEEGTCYLPFNMFDRLVLEEGQKVNISSLKIEPGTFIKIQPHNSEFMTNPQAKSILEENLRRNYFCVTEGDLIVGYFILRSFINGKCFKGRMVDYRQRGKGYVEIHRRRTG